MGQVDDKETITMIDFPQMVSVSHRNAEMLVPNVPFQCKSWIRAYLAFSGSNNFLLLLKCQVF